MHRLWATLVALLLLSRAGQPPAALAALDQPLTFAESLYVKLSGACRAIVTLQYGSTRPRDDIMKSLKIVQLDGENTRTLLIDEALASLRKPTVFDIRRETKVVIHGYKDSSRSAVPLELARAYNDKGLYNVLLLDAELALGQSYPQAVHYARAVGRRLANLLANLESYGVKAEDLHLLGISLGAHVAGWAGKFFWQYRGRRMGRITGLDPAGPCFSHAYSEQRLDWRDAVYVDVVHSNRLVQGAIEALGHSDFYVNGGGPHQPGCMMPSCSHLRAAQVFSESVRSPKSVIGVKCDDWRQFTAGACKAGELAVISHGASAGSRGRYYLRTAPSVPYGLGMLGTRPGPVMNTFMNTINHIPEP